MTLREFAEILEKVKNGNASDEEWAKFIGHLDQAAMSLQEFLMRAKIALTKKKQR